SSHTRTADVYSLGVLLFHLVTNREPVEGQTYLRALRPDLPEEFTTIVERALDVDPRRRFRSAGAFEIALAGFLGAPAENAAFDPSRAVSAAFAAIAARLRRVGW